MTKKQLQLGILFLTIFIDMLGLGIVLPILPRYAQSLGFSSWQMGVLIGIFSLAQMLMLPIWGYLSDRFGRRPIFIISILGTTVGYLLLGLTRSWAMMILARLLNGASGGNISVV